MRKLFLSLLLIPVLAIAQSGYSPFGWVQWRAPVASQSALPATGNAPGDARIDLTAFDVWVWNGSAWQSTSGGTVTSVALSDGSSTPIYSISGSPVTGAGTLTFTLAAESANKVFAGPTSGLAAQPTFRSLVGADLPNPSSSTLGGVESFAAISHEWINQISTSGVVSGSQPACGDLSNAAASCSTDATNAANISSGTLPAGRMPALTGDVTSTAGSVSTTVAAIQTKTVSGTTGTGNVMFSASPTTTGTLTGAAATFSGNVGIGTTVPSHLLDIEASTGTPLYVSTSGSGNNLHLETTDNIAGAASNIYLENTQSNYANYNWVIGNNYTSNGYLQIIPSTTVNGTTYSTPAISIKASNGNVGIGTTSPSSLLEVNGGATFDSTIGVGTTPSTNINAYLNSSLSGSTTESGLYVRPTYSSAATTNMFGIYVLPSIASGSYTTTTYASFFDSGITIPSGVTISNYYGLMLGAPVVSGVITNRYGIYQQDSAATNVLTGNTTVGTSTTTQPHITINSAASSTANGGGYISFTQNGSNGFYVGKYEGVISSGNSPNDVLASTNALLIYSGNSPQVEAAEFDASGEVYFPQSYNNTTASSANMYIASSGEIYRSTSSIKYKKNIKEDVDSSIIDKLRPITYESKNPKEHGRWYGFVAEEVEKIASQFVQHNEKGEPEGINYDRITVPIVKKLQDDDARFAKLEAQLKAQQAEIDALKKECVK